MYRAIVFAMDLSDEDRAALAADGSQSICVQYLSGAVSLLSAVRIGSAPVVVAALDQMSDDQLRLLGELTAQRPTRVVVRAMLSPRSARRIVRCCSFIPNVTVSLTKVDSIKHVLLRILDESIASSPWLNIALRVADVVDDGAFDIVMAAAALSDSRASVQQLADACGVAVRTLELRLQIAGTIPPKKLLGWTLALQTAWRISHLQWSPKKAAGVAGFTSARALANQVHRSTPIRMRELVRGAAFVEVLDSFAEAIKRAEPGRPAHDVGES